MSPFNFIMETFSYDSGGGIMLDVIKLGSGRCLIISEEAIAIYPSWQAFVEGEPSLFRFRNLEDGRPKPSEHPSEHWARIERWARNRGD
jgi:hypothetical protein